jgi:hypothetical protein
MRKKKWQVTCPPSTLKTFWQDFTTYNLNPNLNTSQKKNYFMGILVPKAFQSLIKKRHY